jgi:hypothetical protein
MILNASRLCETTNFNPIIIRPTLVEVGTNERCSLVIHPTKVGAGTDEQCSSVILFYMIVMVVEGTLMMICL